MMKFKTIEEFTDTLRSFSSSVKRGRWFLEDLCYSEFGEENCNKYLQTKRVMMGLMLI